MRNLPSESISFRPFQSGDLEPIVSLWNACLHKDPITSERFWRLFLLDPNFRAEGALVAEFDGRPVGFLQAMVQRPPVGSTTNSPVPGWITAFFVATEFRCLGIGSHLMDLGLEFLRSYQCESVSINGYAPNYAFPGVDVDYVEATSFLEARGFKRIAEPVAMALLFDDWKGSVHVALDITVRPVELQDTLPLLAFAEKQFPHWRECILDGLQVCASNVFVALQGDEVIGFAQWENPQTDPPTGATGRFGPFGVHPELRGQGLGTVIFGKVIEHLKSRGVDSLWFGWAGGRNLSFYERAGCKVTRRYQMFWKGVGC